MILYGSSFSPFVRKVLAFAAEKGVAIDLHRVGRGSDDPAFREANPLGKMPALRDGDYLLADSSAIVAYLEALHPEPALIPVEPRARGTVMFWDEFGDAEMFDAIRPLFFNRVAWPRRMPARRMWCRGCCRFWRRGSRRVCSWSRTGSRWRIWRWSVRW
jgi:glutathione S-transferase